MLNETFGFLGRLSSTVRSGRVWTSLKDVTEAQAGERVFVRARIHSYRGKSNKLGFMVLRERIHAAQAVLCVNEELGVTSDMVKFAKSLPAESIVDIEGIVKKLETPLTMDMITQRTVELDVTKIFCVSQAESRMPVQVSDLSRPLNSEGPFVDFDTQLNNRVIDLRTQANQAIFRMQSMTCQLFREYLGSLGFTEIHSPKLIAGASEGGANVFTLKYFEQMACLAQSPQFYKQMVISGDMDRVFEIGPVFRAENSFTNRHLCEFTGLDMEMAFKESFHEVLDVLDGMFRFIFTGLAERCRDEVLAVRAQYGGEDFMVGKETPKLDFAEMMEELRSRGVEGIPEDLSSYDPGTEVEKALGALVRERYQTDFYMLINYPLGARPFYTMPSEERPTFSNSYDFFMRGQEIVSGAQRIHDPVLLAERAAAHGIPIETVQDYIDAFKYGAFPHGGCGVGLERVVMLFLGLHSVKLTSLFPRDPKRLTP